MSTDQKWPRLRDLPEPERQPFAQWLCGQTRPWLGNAPDTDQDAYFPSDYERWKQGKPIVD